MEVMLPNLPAGLDLQILGYTRKDGFPTEGHSPMSRQRALLARAAAGAPVQVPAAVSFGPGKEPRFSEEPREEEAATPPERFAFADRPASGSSLPPVFPVARRRGGASGEALPETVDLPLRTRGGAVTPVPASLKERVENLSGVAMNDVRVHHNSAKPAQLQALAYTQGTQIHLAPGQERLLPHEAWHVVQQKQGRVIPTLRAPGLAINDDAGLEREADDFGARAARGGEKAFSPPTTPLQAGHSPQVIQGYFVYSGRRLRSMIPEVAALFQGTDGFAATLADYRAKHNSEMPFIFMDWFTAQFQQRGWQDVDIEQRGQGDLKLSVSDVIGNLVDGKYDAPAAQQVAVPEAASAASTADPTAATASSSAAAAAAAAAAADSKSEEPATGSSGSSRQKQNRKRKGPAAASGVGNVANQVQIEPAASRVSPAILAALRQRPAGTMWTLAKSEVVLACWRWALNALGPDATMVDPALFPSYVGGLLDDPDTQKLVGSLSAELLGRLNALQTLVTRKKMRMLDLPENHKPTREFRDDQKTAIAELGEIILAANGFTVVGADAPAEAEIVLQYKLSDGVSWEHWWIELLGGGGAPVIIGTDSERANLEVDDDEAHMRRGVPRKGFGVIRYRVTGLKAGHIKILQAIAAKYAASAPAAAST